MEKQTAGLLGILAGLASIGTAQAAAPAPAVHEVMQVTSYADLLKPIPNAAAVLKASDAELLARANSGPAARLQDAQYYNEPPPDYHHHHHHHHHNQYYAPPPPPPYYHHHHHHHHDQYYAPPPPPVYYHHHHHHHHQGVTIVVPGLGAIRTN